MADIKYLISVDEKGAIKAIQNFDGALKGVKDTTEKQVKPSLGGLWKQFVIGQLAAEALRKGVREVSEFLKGSVTSAIEAEKSQAALASALDTTGRNVKALLPGLVDYSKELQRNTVYSDESVQSAQALLVQLTHLDRNGLDRATEGALGLATVFKVDVDTAAKAVAKAMGGNYDMLVRYMPKLKDVKTESEKHSIVMQTMAQWYGRAKAETDTFGGSLSQLKNAWDEVKETVGGAVIQNESLKEAMKKVKEWVDKLAQSDDFKLWLSIVIDGIMKAVELAVKFAGALKSVGDALAGLKGKNREFEDSQIKLNEALDRARAAGHDLGKRVMPVLATAVDKVGDSTKKAGDAIKDKMLPAFRNLTNVTAGFNLQEYLGGLQDMPEYFNAVLPPARDMRDVLKQATGVVSDLTTKTKKSTTDMAHYFDGLYNDIARGLGDTVEKFLSGPISWKTLGDAAKAVWDDIKKAFFRMIGEMVADAVLGQFKSLFSSISKSATDCIGDVGKAISGAASGWATAIGAALGSFLGTVLAGIISGGPSGHQQQQMINDMKDARNFLAEIRNWFFSAGTGFGGASYEFITGHVGEWLTSIKVSTDLTRDQMIPRLDKIVEYTALLKKIKFGQHGLDTVVRQPTIFMAGERRPERVTITPNFNIGASSSPVIMNGREIARIVFSYLPEMSRDGYAKMYKRGIIGN